MKFTSLFFAILIPIQAQAAEWIEAAKGVHVVIDVDQNSISRYGGNSRKAWARFIYDEPQKTETGQPFNRLAQLSIYKCDDKSIATLQQHFFNDELSSSAIHSRTIPANSVRYAEVIPDSLGDSMVDFICEMKLKKK